MTGEDIFKLAATLMDNVLTNGTLDEDIVREYRAKTPGILTTLQAELIGIQNRYRDVTDMIEPIPIHSLQTTLQIDNISAQTLLPYGLAANLFLHEYKELAAYFQSKYDELKISEFKYLRPRDIEKIDDVYDASLNF